MFMFARAEQLCINSDEEQPTVSPTVQGLLSIVEGSARAPRGEQRKLWVWLGAGAALAGVALLCVTLPVQGSSSLLEHALVALDQAPRTLLTAVAKGPCAGEGQDCHQSGCCLDGGDKGLQCWQKNKFYAACLRDETCQKGVHPGEKHGTYDQYGKFHLDEWSCAKLGNRSQAACETYEKEDDCPSARCDWFRTGKCMPKCGEFYSKEACPATHCVWDGKACGVDPCSGAGEDCSSTKCCSAGRGAGGQQCYVKNKYWATCLDYCDSNTTNKGWSCEKVGERTPLYAPCSWAGKDCSQTHCCGNIGFSCVIKDKDYTGCVQTAIHSTWADTAVQLPAGWDGTVLGKWTTEHAVAPAPQGAPLMGVSFFCFMAVLPNSTEVALMEVAKKTQQGIFGCNDSLVLNSWKSGFSSWDTAEATLKNTEVFFKVWDQVKEDGRYLKYDWTIKVDADCAFLPDRLRSHLWTLRVPAGVPVYIKNTNADAGLSNGQFLGAIEIFSRSAVQTYFDNAEGCKVSLGTHSGEDGYFKGCMDALGVGFMHDGEVLKPDSAASYCLTESKVSFHPLKDPAVLQNCYNAAMGKGIDWSHVTGR